MDTQRRSGAAAVRGDDAVRKVLDRLRLPAPAADDPLARASVAELTTALAHFAELLPPGEMPTEAAELLESVASTNAFEPLRTERGLPVTVVFYAGVHPAYFEGEARVGEAAWRLCYTDGGAVGPSKPKERLLDEVIRLAEAMHDKNPFGEVPFDGGKTIVVQDAGSGHFQAVTALYGEVSMPLFILGKGGVRYYPVGDVTAAQKRGALEAWAASSALADVLATRYVGGPDMRMGEEEMAWVDAAAAGMGAARRRRQLPAVTGLDAGAGGFPHQAWELTGRTVAASLKEALRHPAMARYALPSAGGYPDRPIRVLIQGFGDVGGSVARLLHEESPDFAFEVSGVADEWGAIYRANGLLPEELRRLRAERRPITEYAGPLDALWVATPSDADRARPEFRGADSREMILEEADVFIPAAIPNVIDAQVAPRLRVRVVAEGANNAVAPRAEEDLHRLGILYLPGQAMNWGGVKGSTLEVLFRELTKRTVPFDRVAERVHAALAPLGGIDVPWAVEVLRSRLPGPPLDLEDTRAFAVAVLEDLARSNTRWLMDELAASRHERSPLELVRTLSRNVRSLKVQLLSLIEQALGREFFAPATTLQRASSLLDDKLREMLSETAAEGAALATLTSTQVIEQRQMLQQLQHDIPRGLSPVFASLLAALDLARQKVMDPESYSQESLLRDLEILRDPDAPLADLEGSLYRVQRVHPGPRRPEFVSALVRLVGRPGLSPVARRNAALAVARLGSVEHGDRAVLRAALADPDPTVRAACHWALVQMGLPADGDAD